MKKHSLFINVTINGSLILILIFITIFSLLKITVLPPEYLSATKYFAIISFIMIGFLLIVEIINKFFDKDSTKLSTLVTFCLFISTLTSIDSAYIFGINNYLTLLNVIHNIAVACSFAIFLLFFRHDLGDIINGYSNKLFIIACILFIPIGLVFIISPIFHFEFIASCILFAYLIPILVIGSIITLYKTKLSRYLIITFNLAFSVNIFSVMVELMNSTINDFGNVRPFYGIYSIGYITIAVLYIAIYLNFIIKVTLESYKRKEDLKKIQELQSILLIEQLNPHFIFNTLFLIKNSYHDDLDLGDEAIDLFSELLRASIYSKGEKNILVPISDELNLIEKYMKLTNMRVKDSIELVFDIDDDSIIVPVFSLQIFVENSIKYNKAPGEDENLTIRISAYKEDEYSIVKIVDNGQGFDINLTKNTSSGIKNSKERLKLLLNANLSIQSVKFKGTEITIKIPNTEIERNQQLEEDKENGNNNNR